MTPTLKRGATYQCAIIAREGDAIGATICAVVKMRAAVQRQGDAAPTLAEFTPAWVEHWDGRPESPPGWILTLSAEQTAALPADDCVTDARVSKDGFVIATATQTLRVDQRVTGTPGG